MGNSCIGGPGSDEALPPQLKRKKGGGGGISSSKNDKKNNKNTISSRPQKGIKPKKNTNKKDRKSSVPLSTGVQNVDGHHNSEDAKKRVDSECSTDTNNNSNNINPLTAKANGGRSTPRSKRNSQQLPANNNNNSPNGDYNTNHNDNDHVRYPTENTGDSVGNQQRGKRSCSSSISSSNKNNFLLSSSNNQNNKNENNNGKKKSIDDIRDRSATLGPNDAIQQKEKGGGGGGGGAQQSFLRDDKKTPNDISQTQQPQPTQQETRSQGSEFPSPTARSGPTTMTNAIDFYLPKYNPRTIRKALPLSLLVDHNQFNPHLLQQQQQWHVEEEQPEEDEQHEIIMEKRMEYNDNNNNNNNGNNNNNNYGGASSAPTAHAAPQVHVSPQSGSSPYSSSSPAAYLLHTPGPRGNTLPPLSIITSSPTAASSNLQQQQVGVIGASQLASETMSRGAPPPIHSAIAVSPTRNLMGTVYTNTNNNNNNNNNNKNKTQNEVSNNDNNINNGIIPVQRNQWNNQANYYGGGGNINTNTSDPKNQGMLPSLSLFPSPPTIFLSNNLHRQHSKETESNANMPSLAALVGAGGGSGGPYGGFGVVSLGMPHHNTADTMAKAGTSFSDSSGAGGGGGAFGLSRSSRQNTSNTTATTNTTNTTFTMNSGVGLAGGGSLIPSLGTQPHQPQQQLSFELSTSAGGGGGTGSSIVGMATTGMNQQQQQNKSDFSGPPNFLGSGGGVGSLPLTQWSRNVVGVGVGAHQHPSNFQQQQQQNQQGYNINNRGESIVGKLQQQQRQPVLSEKRDESPMHDGTLGDGEGYDEDNSRGGLYDDHGQEDGATKMKMNKRRKRKKKKKKKGINFADDESSDYENGDCDDDYENNEELDDDDRDGTNSRDGGRDGMDSEESDRASQRSYTSSIRSTASSIGSGRNAVNRQAEDDPIYNQRSYSSVSARIATAKQQLHQQQQQQQQQQTLQQQIGLSPWGALSSPSSVVVGAGGMQQNTNFRGGAPTPTLFSPPPQLGSPSSSAHGGAGAMSPSEAAHFASLGANIAALSAAAKATEDFLVQQQRRLAEAHAALDAIDKELESARKIEAGENGNQNKSVDNSNNNNNNLAVEARKDYLHKQRQYYLQLAQQAANSVTAEQQERLHAQRNALLTAQQEAIDEQLVMDYILGEPELEPEHDLDSHSDFDIGGGGGRGGDGRSFSDTSSFNKINNGDRLSPRGGAGGGGLGGARQYQHHKPENSASFGRGGAAGGASPRNNQNARFVVTEDTMSDRLSIASGGSVGTGINTAAAAASAAMFMHRNNNNGLPAVISSPTSPTLLNPAFGGPSRQHHVGLGSDVSGFANHYGQGGGGGPTVPQSTSSVPRQEYSAKRVVASSIPSTLPFAVASSSTPPRNFSTNPSLQSFIMPAMSPSIM